MAMMSDRFAERMIREARVLYRAAMDPSVYTRNPGAVNTKTPDLEAALREYGSSLPPVEPAVVEATEIHEYVCELWNTDSEKLSGDFRKDFPTVVSPWEHSIIEFKTAAEPELNRAAYYTAVAVTQERTAVGFDITLAMYISKVREREPIAVTAYLVRADRTGAFISTAKIAKSARVRDEKLEDWFLVSTPFMVHSLLGCRNVTTTDHATPPKIARRRAERGEPVGVTYKTLDLHPMRAAIARDAASRGERPTLTKALHMVRGNFATYTEEKPLFGRVTGTIWRPQHVRGAEAAGTIHKDYRVRKD